MRYAFIGQLKNNNNNNEQIAKVISKLQTHNKNPYDRIFYQHRCTNNHICIPKKKHAKIERGPPSQIRHHLYDRQTRSSPNGYVKATLLCTQTGNSWSRQR